MMYTVICMFFSTYGKRYIQRRDIIVGSHEPTDEESAWSDESDEEDKTPDGQTSGTNGDSSGEEYSL